MNPPLAVSRLRWLKLAILLYPWDEGEGPPDRYAVEHAETDVALSEALVGSQCMEPQHWDKLSQWVKDPEVSEF